MNKDWIYDIIERVPDYKVFMTVDEINAATRELAANYPDQAELFVLGHSRDNEKILGLKIGSGKKNALVFGMPHPNEPIGTMLLDYLAQELVSNKKLQEEMDYTWYLVKTWDIDGLRLNEGWLKGPFTLYNYARNFFRPAGHQQVDWTFPVDYKDLHFKDTIPETQAMMELIDKIQPDFIYSLHNAGFGGVYWYLTHELKELQEDFYAAAAKQEVPLSLGEPEAPFLERYAPAIFKELGIEDQYDWLEENGVENVAEALGVGTCSADYAKQKYNSFCMLTELPYFFNPEINNLNESDVLRKDVVREKILDNIESNKYILKSLSISRPYLHERNPFKLALEAFTKPEDNEATLQMIEKDPEYQKKATVAEVLDNRHVYRVYKLLSYGLLVRANESELEKMRTNLEVNPEKERVLKQQMAAAEAELKRQADILEQELDYDVIPIKKLVSIQLECGLLAAKYVNDHKMR